MIRVGLSHSRPGQREAVKLLGSLHRFFANLHTIPFIEMSLLRLIGVIYSGGQAGSAAAEPALLPIGCSQ
jgi:hypothetical protein